MLRFFSSLSIVFVALSKSTDNDSLKQVRKFLSQDARKQLQTERGMEIQSVVAEKYMGETTLSQNITVTVDKLPANSDYNEKITYWKINIPVHQAVRVDTSNLPSCGDYGFSQELESPDTNTCNGCGNVPKTDGELLSGWNGEDYVPSCVFRITKLQLYFWVQSSCTEEIFTLRLSPEQETCDIPEMPIPANGGTLSVPNSTSWAKFTFSTSTGKKLALKLDSGSAYYANKERIYSSPESFIVAVPNWALFIYVPAEEETSFTFTLEDFKCRDPALDVDEEGNSQHSYCKIPGTYALDENSVSAAVFGEAFLGFAALFTPLGCAGSFICAQLYPECDARNMKRQVCADGFCSMLSSCPNLDNDADFLTECNTAVSSSLDQATLDSQTSEFQSDKSWQPPIPLASVCDDNTLTPNEFKSRYSPASQAIPVYLVALLATLFY